MGPPGLERLGGDDPGHPPHATRPISGGRWELEAETGSVAVGQRTGWNKKGLRETKGRFYLPASPPATRSDLPCQARAFCICGRVPAWPRSPSEASVSHFMLTQQSSAKQ